MPQEILRQVNFTGGQLDPSLKGRRDFKGYFTGLQSAANCSFAAQGPIGRRPGLGFVDAIRGPLQAVAVSYANATFPNGSTGSTTLDPSAGDTLTISTDIGDIAAGAEFVLLELDLGAVQAISAVDLVDYAVGAGALPPDVGATFTYDASWAIAGAQFKMYDLPYGYWP